MELDPVPPIINTPSSSSKKKKSKKEKKRKHAEAVSTPPNGSKIGSGNSSSKKSKKKDKKKRKKERAESDSIEKSGPSSEHQQQEQLTGSQESTPPSAVELQKPSPEKSRTATQPTTTGPTGSIFSLVAKPSSSANSSKTKNSPYQIKTILGTVALLPSSLPDVPKCIQSLLHSLLLMYDTNMGGVLLSLEEGVELLPVLDHGAAADGGIGARGGGGLIGGRIVDDLPYVHYRFRVGGLLFCPAVGMALEGRVVECTPTFVTLTSHHILSTKISSEKLHERGFVYDAKTLAWTSERGADRADGGGDEEEDDVFLGPSTSIYLDDSVEFVVERIHECGGYISLDGSHPSVPALG